MLAALLFVFFIQIYFFPYYILGHAVQAEINSPDVLANNAQKAHDNAADEH